MSASAEIHLDTDGVTILVKESEQISGWSPKLRIGDRWVIGAIDTEQFPYEVSIVVVNRIER